MSLIVETSKLKSDIFVTDKWNSSAKGYEKWRFFLEREFNKVSARMGDLVRPANNTKVLDIATGYGEPAITIATLSPTSQVFAVDISVAMLNIAIRVAKERGLENIQFNVNDINKMTLPSNYYDSIVCRWGIMLFSDLDIVLKNIYESLKKGGKFAAAVWGPPDRVPLISIPQSVLKPYILMYSNNPSCNSNGPFSLSDINKLNDYFCRACFNDIFTEKIELTIKMDSLEEFIRGVKEFNIDTLPSKFDNSITEKIITELKNRVSKFIDPNTGVITLKNEAILICGTK